MSLYQRMNAVLQTKWHLGEKMMYDVEMRDIVKEKMTDEPEKLSVHGRSGATLKIPLPGAVVR